MVRSKSTLRRTGLGLSALFASSACMSRATVAPGNAPKPATVLVAPPPATPLLQAEEPQLNRPAAQREELVPDSAYPVFVTERQILIGDPPQRVLELPTATERGATGVGARNKDSAEARYVLPLAAALAKRSCEADGRVPPIAILHVDRNMQYRVLIEVLFTLSELGYAELFLATRSPPKPSGHSSWYGFRLRSGHTPELQVSLRKAGFSLRNKDSSEFDASCHEVLMPLDSGSSGQVLTLTDVQRCVSTLAGTEGAIQLALDGPSPVQAMMPLLEAFGPERAVIPTFPAASLEADVPVNCNALRVLAGLQSTFRRCYTIALRKNPDNAGKIRLSIVIAESGTVASASAAVEGNLQPSIGECVRAVAASAQFDPPAFGREQLVVPLTFAPKSESIAARPPCADRQGTHY